MHAALQSASDNEAEDQYAEADAAEAFLGTLGYYPVRDAGAERHLLIVTPREGESRASRAKKICVCHKNTFIRFRFFSIRTRVSPFILTPCSGSWRRMKRTALRRRAARRRRIGARHARTKKRGGAFCFDRRGAAELLEHTRRDSKNQRSKQRAEREGNEAFVIN